MNVYEEAHRLEKAIRESDEFKEYDKLKKQIDANPDLQKMVQDFQSKQMEIQMAQFQAAQNGGGEPELTPELAETIQELSAIMMSDPLLASYIQAQMRLSIMLGDVYKIIGDVIDLGNIM